MMRAKMYVESVKQFGADGKVTAEEITFRCVSSSPFGPNGESEDNTFARYSPNGTLTIQITNPDLLGSLRPGEKYYLDFTRAAA